MRVPAQTRAGPIDVRIAAQIDVQPRVVARGWMWPCGMPWPWPCLQLGLQERQLGVSARKGAPQVLDLRHMLPACVLRAAC